MSGQEKATPHTAQDLTLPALTTPLSHIQPPSLSLMPETSTCSPARLPRCLNSSMEWGWGRGHHWDSKGTCVCPWTTIHPLPTKPPLWLINWRKVCNKIPWEFGG